MILPEWTARKEAGVTPPPAGSFFVPFEAPFHMPSDRFSNDKQTGAPHETRKPRSALPPAAGSYRELISTPRRGKAFFEISPFLFLHASGWYLLQR